MHKAATPISLIRARVREFTIPPIHDALILGTECPIGCVALRKAWSLLVPSKFEHIKLQDPIVGDILVRSNILRRISRDDLMEFVLNHVKPLMGADDILHLDIESETFVESSRMRP